MGFGKQVGRVYVIENSASRRRTVFPGNDNPRRKKLGGAILNPFWSLDFRARFACLKCPNHAYNLIELSPEMNDFAIMTANDRGFFLNERCLSTRRNNPGFDLARKQGCAFSLTLRRRYVLLIAASISLLTQRDTMMTIL